MDKRYTLDIDTANGILIRVGLSPIQTIRRLSGGIVNDIFSLDDRLVIKIFSGSSDIRKRNEKEKQVYEILKAKPVSIAQIYMADSSHTVLPHDYIVMDYVAGESLEVSWPELSFIEKKVYLGVLGTQLAHVHLVHPRTFGDTLYPLDSQNGDPFTVYFGKTVDMIVLKLRNSGILEESRIQRLEEYFHTTPLFKINPQPSLIHFNFGFTNVLAKNGDVRAIVDWEWARSGHREEDVSTFLYRELHMDSVQTEAFLGTYEKIYPLDAGFSDRVLAYNLLYYVRVLPYMYQRNIPKEKLDEYISETQKLFDIVIR